MLLAFCQNVIFELGLGNPHVASFSEADPSMRTSCLLLVIAFAGGCAPPPAATPFDTVRNYVATADAEKRLQLVFNPDAVRPLIGDPRYGVGTGFEDVRIDPPQRLEHSGEWYGVHVTYRKGTTAGETQFYVGRAANEFRIDWPATVGYNVKPLRDMMGPAGEQPQHYRVRGHLMNYYSHEYWGTEAQYQCVALTDLSGQSSVYGYIRRESEAGLALTRLLNAEPNRTVTLLLSRSGPNGERIENAESEIVRIEAVASNDWHY
jgi:hypothetical protein